jgi:hypothetical protein
VRDQQKSGLKSMRSIRPLSLAALWLLLSSPSAAEVFLTLGDGRASLHAENATTAEILSAWARTGNTTILNLEKLDSTPVTLTLEDVPERMALDVILRSAAGFVAIQRPIDEGGVSRIARIVILPRSTAKVEAVTTADVYQPAVEAAAQDVSALPLAEPTEVERLLGPDGEPIPDDQDDLAPSQPAPANDGVEPAPADELRPDGAVIPAQPR